MKYTIARLVFVAAVAAMVGVFVALIVYFTLLAALIFLLVATVTAVAIMTNTRKRARGSLENVEVKPVDRLARPGAGERTNSAQDENQR